MYLAGSIFFSKPATDKKQNVKNTSLFKLYTSTLLLTLANPTTILSFIAVFAGLGIVTITHSYNHASAIVIGVFFGSAVWWYILSVGIGFFEEKMNYQRLVWANRLSGILIGILGLLSLLSII